MLHKKWFEKLLIQHINTIKFSFIFSWGGMGGWVGSDEEKFAMEIA